MNADPPDPPDPPDTAEESRVIVAMGEDGRAYVPMADHERLRRRAEHLWAALVGISQLLGPLYESTGPAPQNHDGN